MYPLLRVWKFPRPHVSCNIHHEICRNKKNTTSAHIFWNIFWPSNFFSGHPIFKIIFLKENITARIFNVGKRIVHDLETHKLKRRCTDKWLALSREHKLFVEIRKWESRKIPNCKQSLQCSWSEVEDGGFSNIRSINLEPGRVLRFRCRQASMCAGCQESVTRSRKTEEIQR